MRAGICTLHDFRLPVRLPSPATQYGLRVYYWHYRINCPTRPGSAAFTMRPCSQQLRLLLHESMSIPPPHYLRQRNYSVPNHPASPPIPHDRLSCPVLYPRLLSPLLLPRTYLPPTTRLSPITPAPNYLPTPTYPPHLHHTHLTFPPPSNIKINN